MGGSEKRNACCWQVITCVPIKQSIGGKDCCIDLKTEEVHLYYRKAHFSTSPKCLYFVPSGIIFLCAIWVSRFPSFPPCHLVNALYFWPENENFTGKLSWFFGCWFFWVSYLVLLLPFHDLWNYCRFSDPVCGSGVYHCIFPFSLSLLPDDGLLKPYSRFFFFLVHSSISCVLCFWWTNRQSCPFYSCLSVECVFLYFSFDRTDGVSLNLLALKYHYISLCNIWSGCFFFWQETVLSLRFLIFVKKWYNRL